MTGPVNFLIVGTQKGGTTAAAEFVAQHPQVCFARPKELHFFTDDAFYPDFERYHRHFEGIAGKTAIGEATPLYMVFAFALQRIRDYNPGMKLIFLLRNPTERAYSHYQMNLRLRLEHLPFSECIRTEPLRLSQTGASVPHHSYVSRGLYYEQLKTALKLFPREQLLILRTEQLAQRHDETMEQVFGFLGVDAKFRVLAARVHDQKYDAPMSAEDRKFLVGKFEADLKKVEKLLGCDLSAWR